MLSMAIPGKDPRLTPYGDTNLGTPPDLLDRFIIPNDRFFVRSNGPIPTLDPATWRLRVTGQVAKECTFTLEDLQRFPRRVITAFLECAGNSRTRFTPPAEGTPWKNDAIGNAEWVGTSLHHVLDAAGMRDTAVDVVTQGADLPDMRRALPVPVTRDPDVLLVWEMNGEPLPIPHGGPVRLLVPRWGGIASTKWLVGLEALDRPFTGHYQGDLYVLITPQGEKVVPVREMPVKSIITYPGSGAALQPGTITVTGFAWSGFAGIDRVEVSPDGGEHWTEATITERAGPLAWVRWTWAWQALPGQARLCCRAVDERGLSQPWSPTWNAKGYQNNAIDCVDVLIAGASNSAH
jgi:sulfane dehydrogenase subunit SoxC